MSAWDASWSEVHRDLAKRIDRILFGEGYEKVVHGRYSSKRATSRFVRCFMDAYHFSGDGDNSGGNGDIHVLILTCLLIIVYGRNPLIDEDVQMFAEGDDSHYTCLGIEDPEKMWIMPQFDTQSTKTSKLYQVLSELLVCCWFSFTFPTGATYPS